VCKYYANNTAQVVGLLQGIEQAGGVKRFVFSSTCCTYGDVPSADMPITEETSTAAASGAYGKSKLAVEMMLHDYHAACIKIGRPMGLAVLRYFNVAGCDRGGVLGEARVKQIRIIPILLEAALGKRDGVSIFGTDHPTRDGTAIRDYIHVDDLSDAHVHVMQSMDNASKVLYNLGIGQGMSVRELIAATKRVTGVDFKVTEAPRVEGEAAEVFCDPSKVLRETGWKAKVTDIDEIIRSAWNFMQKYPDGYP
jgi:UDP-glucose 4-epimerase